jgi:hypothetical protein
MAGAFQEDAFQEDAFQVEAAVVVPDEEMGDVLGRVFRFKPPTLLFMHQARIRQTAPAFTQSLTARVTDDELVLVLL